MAGEANSPESNQSSRRRGHVILFPFMAQGHLIPFLTLAKLLESKTSFTITLVNTPLNILTLRSSLPPTTTIRFSSLPFSSTDHNLPPNTQNGDTICYPNIIHLLQASQTLQPSFEDLISVISTQEKQTPRCIIADVFLGWTATVAERFGIFHAVFNTSGAYGQAVYFSLWLNLPHRCTDSGRFRLPDFDGVWVERSQLSNHLLVADGGDEWSVFLRREIGLCLDRSCGMICNSVEEMEKKGVEQLRRKMMGKPVWTIGPLLPPVEAYAGKEPGMTRESCVEWLDLHPPCSVLYISFGSQNTISPSQMMQLAMGLEASEKAFIWVVRPPLGVPVGEEFRPEWLPEGFEDRLKVRKHGILVRKWAPQMQILSHRSIAAFLSHCGWNSVLESLSRGVPIIGWPISGEQFYNCKFLEEELGVCVEVVRGTRCEVGCDHVERIARLVMDGGEKGEEMRKRAGCIKEMMREAIQEDDGCNGSSIRGLDGFIATVASYTSRQNVGP